MEYQALSVVFNIVTECFALLLGLNRNKIYNPILLEQLSTNDQINWLIQLQWGHENDYTTLFILRYYFPVSAYR